VSEASVGWTFRLSRPPRDKRQVSEPRHGMSAARPPPSAQPLAPAMTQQCHALVLARCAHKDCNDEGRAETSFSWGLEKISLRRVSDKRQVSWARRGR
jgi:hypothetical protein